MSCIRLENPLGIETFAELFQEDLARRVRCIRLENPLGIETRELVEEHLDVDTLHQVRKPVRD